MKGGKRLLMIALLAAALPASALDLQGAKSRGLVGETPSGYLATVSGGAEAEALVAKINAERRARYQGIAAENRVGLSEVEQLAGKKAIEKTPAGEYVRLPSGEWVRK